MKEYDLHNHTSRSKDGEISGRDLIDMAVDRGLKGLGICDHDEFLMKVFIPMLLKKE